LGKKEVASADLGEEKKKIKKEKKKKGKTT